MGRLQGRVHTSEGGGDQVMQHHDRYLTVRPYLPAAAAATAAVVFVPMAAVAALAGAASPRGPVLVLAGVAVSLGLAIAGSALWARKPQSRDIAFGELMLWRWWRRKQAEERVARDATNLGVDPEGRPRRKRPSTFEEQLALLRDLIAALEAKDLYTHGHSKRVERHVRRTAAEMGLSGDDVEAVSAAAALHDVGKIRVPDRTLRKPGPLDDREQRVVEEHVLVGAWMVTGVLDASGIAAVRHHHERFDGTGYPDGLAGDGVPLFARMIAVADAFDAMTSTRPYRPAMGRAAAIDKLRAGTGTQFDPMIVEAFIAALGRTAAVPIAGAFALLGGDLFRRMLSGAHRVAAGSLAPAVGAVGVAAVVGTAVPPPAEPPPPPAARVAPQLVPSTGTDFKERPGSAGREPRRRGAGGAPVIATDPGPSGAAAVLAATADETEPAPDTGLEETEQQPAPEPQPPAPEPQPPASEPPAPAPAPPASEPAAKGKRKGHGDPQPDKGKDCPPRRGKGSSRHCG